MASSLKSQPDYYETLGVKPSASDRDIAEAYAARINKYLVPPDEADPSLRDEARQFMSAYKTLSDPSRRRAYDASLKLVPRAAPPAESEADAKSTVTPFIRPDRESENEEGAPDLWAWSKPGDRDEAGITDEPAREPKEQSSVAAAQGYTLGYFARKHNLSREQARELMARVGNDRERLNAAAEQLKEAPEPDRAPESRAAPGFPPATDADVEQSTVLEPDPASQADSDYDDDEQTSWAPAGYASSDGRARRLHLGKIGVALLVAGFIAISALLLGGYFTRPEGTGRQNMPANLTLSGDRSKALNNATPQQGVPSPGTSQTMGGLTLNQPGAQGSPASNTAATTAELPSSPQIPLPPSGEKQPSNTIPSPTGPQPAAAPQGKGQPAPSNEPVFEELSPAPSAPPAAEPVVVQDLSSPPAGATVKSLPKWVGGAITGKDNPHGRFRGIVSVQFTVDGGGQVSGCRTASSSGNPVLDSRTCQLVEQRLRFSPALDDQGRPVSWPMRATYMWGHKNWRPQGR